MPNEKKCSCVVDEVDQTYNICDHCKELAKEQNEPTRRTKELNRILAVEGNKNRMIAFFGQDITDQIVQACNAHGDHVATIKAQAQKILEQHRNLGEYAELCRVEATWKDEKDELVGALKFYADAKNWEVPNVYGPPETEPEISNIDKDGGSFAFNALKSAGVK